MPAYDPNSWEEGRVRLGIQGPLQLYTESKASLESMGPQLSGESHKLS